MIICTHCGEHNTEEDGAFCGSCGRYLEFVGEKVDDAGQPAPVAPDVLPAEDRREQAHAPSQQPAVVPDRPKRERTKAPPRPIKPDDIVCRQCGAGNDPSRRFCRTCGASLAPVPVEVRLPWYRRIFRRRTSTPHAAGTPRQQSGQPADRRTSSRRATHGVRRGVALAALIGIGALVAIPTTRTWLSETTSDAYDRVRRVFADYTAVPASNIDATAEAHEARLLVDGAVNTEWSAPAGAPNQTITATFEPAQTVDLVLITLGNPNDATSFNAQPRPGELMISVTNADGEVTSEPVTLEYQPEFQQVDVDGGLVRQIQFTITSCTASPVGTECSLAELEFRQQ